MDQVETRRPQYERGLNRYAIDCSDEERAIIEPVTGSFVVRIFRQRLIMSRSKLALPTICYGEVEPAFSISALRPKPA